MGLGALDNNFLLASAALLTSWFAIATLIWVLFRWRYLSRGKSEKAERAASCAKTWGLIAVVVLVVVAVILSILIITNNAALFRACLDCVL